MNTFYHLTTEEKLEKILKEGIRPQLGDKSSLVHEKEPAIYLCKKDDLPYWKILLQRPFFLEIVGVDEEQTQKFKYDYYNEYLYKKTISPDQIKSVNPASNIVADFAMTNLCLSYLYSFSRYVVACATYYVQEQPEARYGQIKAMTDSLLAVLPHLNYSVLQKSSIRKALKEYGEDGEYALTDAYEGSGYKLWEMLIHYPEDEFTEGRTTIYNFLAKNLEGCLDINTGGWIPEEHLPCNRTMSM